jgi:integrase
MHAILRAALGQALKCNLVLRNVAKLAHAPRVEQTEIEPLSPEQARQLLDAAKGDRLAALYSVAIALGLRQGETLGLRWQDIDLDRRLLRVRSQLQRIDGAPQLVRPNTASSRRTIELPGVVLDALREHQLRQSAERLAAGAAWQEHGLVFATRIGTPLDARNVVRQYHALLAKAGLPRLRFHDLRHTAASLLLAQGLELRVIQHVLGHSQISLTANLYTHVMPVLLKEAAAKMDAVLRDP